MESMLHYGFWTILFQNSITGSMRSCDLICGINQIHDKMQRKMNRGKIKVEGKLFSKRSKQYWLLQVVGIILNFIGRIGIEIAMSILVQKIKQE